MGYGYKPKIVWLPRGTSIENGLIFMYNDDLALKFFLYMNHLM